jgi:hypothetical protein
MFDSDDTTIIAGPHCAGARVATYADLMTPALAANLRGRLAVIDRGTGDPMKLAHIADIESGALTVAEGAARVRQWHAEGRTFPTVYCDRNDWPAVTAALTGVPHSTWIATLDGTLLPDGKRPDIVQAFGAAAIGFHADMSIVWNDAWLPVRPAVTWTQVSELYAAGEAVAKIAMALK